MWLHIHTARMHQIQSDADIYLSICVHVEADADSLDCWKFTASRHDSSLSSTITCRLWAYKRRDEEESSKSSSSRVSVNGEEEEGHAWETGRRRSPCWAPSRSRGSNGDADLHGVELHAVFDRSKHLVLLFLLSEAIALAFYLSTSIYPSSLSLRVDRTLTPNPLLSSDSSLSHVEKLKPRRFTSLIVSCQCNSIRLQSMWADARDPPPFVQQCVGLAGDLKAVLRWGSHLCCICKQQLLMQTIRTAASMTVNVSACRHISGCRQPNTLPRGSQVASCWKSLTMIGNTSSSSPYLLFFISLSTEIVAKKPW